MSVDEILEKVLADNFADVTFSGGKPHVSAQKASPNWHTPSKNGAGKTSGAIRGYTFEKLLNNPRQAKLLEYIDVLVDGKIQRRAAG